VVVAGIDVGGSGSHEGWLLFFCGIGGVCSGRQLIQVVVNDCSLPFCEGVEYGQLLSVLQSKQEKIAFQGVSIQ